MQFFEDSAVPTAPEPLEPVTVTLEDGTTITELPQAPPPYEPPVPTCAYFGQMVFYRPPTLRSQYELAYVKGCRDGIFMLWLVESLSTVTCMYSPCDAPNTFGILPNDLTPGCEWPLI